MDTGIDGKVALITGAGRNIGRATALAFAAEGARLVLATRRSADRLEETAAACRALGADAVTTLCDVSDEQQVAAMFDAARQAFGGVDVLVNNAANRVQGPFLQSTTEDWRATAGVNLDGVIFACRAALPGMVERGWGRIVNYSGVSAYRGGGALKAAVKLGVVGLTRGLAREFGKHGVTVNAIAPASIEGERDPGTERDVDLAGVDPKLPSRASASRRRSRRSSCTSAASTRATLRARPSTSTAGKSCSSRGRGNLTASPPSGGRGAC